MGRRSTYSPAVIERIAARLSLGEPMAVICRDTGMPAYRTVKDWIDNNLTVAAAIALAREAGFDAIAAECLMIANTPVAGVVEKYEPVTTHDPDDPEGKPVTRFELTERKVEDMLGHRRLQVETRLKLLAKWDPKRYGDRVSVDHGAQDSLLTMIGQSYYSPTKVLSGPDDLDGLLPGPEEGGS